MKKYSILICVCLCMALLQEAFPQGVTIGSPNPPDPSAVLDVQSTQGGFVLPRMTTAQRNAIPNPAEGLQIYNLTTHCLEIYFPSIGWTAVKCDCSQAPPQPGAITGNTTVCPNGLGVTYSINAVPGAISYTWTVPPGASIASGQGTTGITVNYGTQPGTVSVTADNTCGISSPVSVTITQSSVNANFSSSPGTPNANVPAVFTPAFTQPGTNYQWTFTSGNPATSVLQNPSVTWSLAGTYAVGLIVTDVNGCSDTVSQNVSVTNCPPPYTLTLTNCGATGRDGPNQTQANNTYGNGIVTVSSGIQLWTVPSSGNYQIEVAGAKAGGTYGGNGAKITGKFALTAGQVLKIIVGQTGIGSDNAGGGGGTFVATSTNTPLIIAGGGGSSNSTNAHEKDGRTNETGGNAFGNPDPYYNGTPGSNGSGSTQQYPYLGGAGGFSGDGTTNSNCDGGKAFINGGRGGGGQWYGGFGGGGASDASGWSRMGGGGGYSGGAGGLLSGQLSAGGGGSYVNAAATSVGTSNGLYNGSGTFNGNSIQNMNSYNTGNGYVTITLVCP